MDGGDGRTQVAGTIHATSFLLNSMVSALRLNEIWRRHHPLDREYMHMSHEHDCSAHIDYLFCSKPALSLILQLEEHKILVWDYAPISIFLSKNQPRSETFVWRITSHLPRDETFLQMVNGTNMS